jgi:phosphoglycolate phosphatase
VAAAYGYMGQQADLTLWQADAAISSPGDLLQWLDRA